MIRNSISLMALVLAASVVPAAAQAEEAAAGSAAKPMTNKDWWPNLLDLSALRQGDAGANPYGTDFNYAKAFPAALDLAAVYGQEGYRHRAAPAPCSWWPAGLRQLRSVLHPVSPGIAPALIARSTGAAVVTAASTGSNR